MKKSQIVKARKTRAPVQPTFKLHGWLIIRNETTILTMKGPRGDQVICLFLKKIHADKVMLSLPAGHKVKHYGLAELRLIEEQ